MATAAMERVWDMAEAPAVEPIEAPNSPWWHALLVPPNREIKSAEWLRRFIEMVYLPTFKTQVFRSRRCFIRRPRDIAAIPGMIFVPVDQLDIPRRRDVFDYARVRGFMRACDGMPQIIHKADIDKIKVMEARLNLPPEAKGVFFKVNQRVRFCSDILESWGCGTIFQIASEARIGVEIDRLFGRAVKVYVPASEIEAL